MSDATQLILDSVQTINDTLVTVTSDTPLIVGQLDSTVVYN
jgi:hypothetical protein